MRAPSNADIRKLYAYWFLLEFQLWIPVWIVFLTLDRGFTLTQVTVAEGLYLVAVLALEVPTGAVADRYGRTRSMGIGVFLLGVSILIFAFTTSFAILMASFMLWALAHALMSGADKALCFDILKGMGRESEYERIAGRGIALQWAGVLVATLLGGPVAALTSVRTTIFIGAATCIVSTVLAFSMREALREDTGKPQAAYLPTIKAAFGEAWRVVDVRIVILLAGSTLAMLEAIFYLVQPFLIDRDIAVGVWFSLLQVPMLLAGLGGALIAGRLHERIGSLRAFIAVPLFGVVGYLALASMPGMTPYLALPAIMALSSCLEPIAAGYINRRIGSERRATVLSIQSMVRSLVLAALVPALGFTIDESSLDHAFLLGGGVALASIAILAPFLIRWVGSKPLPPPELEPAGASGP